MIPAVLAPAAALLARLGPVLARLEPRHWVALVGSAGLHLGVLLGLSQAPPPLPPPLTFEVTLEPPPAVKQPKQRRAEAKPKASKVKAKKRLAKKKPVKPQAHEPHTLQAEWKSETRPAKDTPAVTLPDARALGVDLAKASGRAAPAKLATTSTQPGAASPAAAARAGATDTLSEPGGKSGAGIGAASGGDPGIALAAAQGLGKTQALSASSGAGAQGSDALAGSAAASGNLAAASLAASAAAGSGLNRAAGGGGQSVQASAFSSHNPGAMVAVESSGEPGGVRLTMAGVLSSLAALPAGSGSLASGQLSGVAGTSAATAGQGSQASLATAASSGQPAVVAGAGPTRAGAGSEISAASERAVAASGGSGAGNLASAAPGSALPSSKTTSGQGGDRNGGNLATSALAAAVTAPHAGKTETALARVGAGDSAGKAPTPRKTLPGGGEAAARTAAAVTGATTGGDKLSRAAVDAKPAAAGHAATLDRGGADGTPGNVGLATAGEPPSTGSATHGLAGAGFAAAGKLAGSASPGAAAPRPAVSGSGFSSGPAAPAALALGEPGSAPRLALAMQAVPAILEMRPGGARSSFRAQAGEGGSGGPAHNTGTALVQAGGGAGAPLQARGDAAPALSNASRQASVGSGGGNPAGTGSLQGVRAAAVQQMRADSQVQPLDVLAPSTYCPLPGHVQPDNRPRNTAQEITEKPAYASDNPSFAFPLRAWAYGHQGRATVRVQIMEDGTPGQMWIKQSSGSGILDVDAREQLAKYRFKPARKNGQPVTAWIDVPVDYRLNAESKP
ncbi:MAG: TonB family protein [Pseudomonadota bacterium]|nr:TonB family protein [Pseudomonadota bacterium]